MIGFINRQNNCCSKKEQMSIFIVGWFCLGLFSLLLFSALTNDSTKAHNSINAETAFITQNKSSTLNNIAKEFVYPIGTKGYATQKKDGDGWYNAREFREVNHLGEDWNKESGGNTDCGLPVRAISNGRIIFAKTNIEGWGNVLILRHLLPDGKEIESLYGHLKSFTKTSGEVAMGETIGLIGDGGGIYTCHLHLEIRFSNCPSWGQTGPGYSLDSTGWVDPSSFIDSHRLTKAGKVARDKRKGLK